MSVQTGFFESSLPCYLGRSQQPCPQVRQPSGWELFVGSPQVPWEMRPGQPRSPPGSWLITRHHFRLPCLPHLPSLPHWYLLPSKPPELSPLPHICFWRIPKQDAISPCPWREVAPTCPPRSSWSQPCTARPPPRHAGWRPTWGNRVLWLPRRPPAASQGSVGLMGAPSCLGWEPGLSRLLALSSSAWQAQASLIRSLPLSN